MTPSLSFFFNLNDIKISDFFELLSELRKPLTNTILYCIAVSTISTILGTSIFWLINFHQFRFAWLWKYVLFIPTLIPIYIAAFADAHFFEYTDFINKIFPHLKFRNYIGATIVASCALYPYVYILMQSTFKKIQNIITVSRLNGYKSWQIYWQVMFSSARPTIIFAISIVSMEIIAEYGMSNQYGLNNLTNFLYRKWFYTHEYHYASMAGIIVFAIIAIFLIMEESYRKNNNYAANMHQNNINKFKLTRTCSILANLYCGMIGIVAVFIPIGELIYLASQKISEFYQNHKISEFFYLSINTIYISSIIAILSIIMGYIINHILQKNNSEANRFSKIFNYILKGLITFAYGIPGAFIAISIIIWCDKVSGFISGFSMITAQWMRYTFFGTIFGIVYSCLFRFSNIAIYTINSGLIIQKREISLVKKIYSGSDFISRIRTFIWSLPLHFREIIVVFLVVFIDSIKELPITLILRPFNFSNLSIKTYELISDERYEEAAIPALLLIFLLMIITSIFLKLMEERR
jgi:iron(III) transport system permease protein